MATRDRFFLMEGATMGPREPREQEDFPMATYHTIRGQILARVPGIDPADIPSVLQMLVSTNDRGEAVTPDSGWSCVAM